MQAGYHSVEDLFGQLGLPNDEASIKQFVEKNKTTDDSQTLESMPVWSESQKQFLLEARSDDAEWSEPVDVLDALLHQ